MIEVMRTMTGGGLALALLGGVACGGGCGQASPAGTGQQVPGQPVETRSPNADWQQPAFPGQTRAPFKTAGVEFDVRVVAKGLERPWSIAFLPDGAMLVTEKPGRMRILAKDGASSEPLAGVPTVDGAGLGGLLDVVLGPSFNNDGAVFFAFSEPRGDAGNGTAVARAKLVREGPPRLEDVKIVWRMTPTFDSDKHFGSRLVFKDGVLFITLGERSDLGGRRQAQQLESSFGKIMRITPDGGVPQDNPFLSRQGAQKEIFSFGHRNIQAAALHPQTGELWVVDHGPRGGDEINVARAGQDYGWPTITYGIEYTGGKVGEGLTRQDGMQQPLYYWDPSIAPSGMAFYDGSAFPAWKGSLFVGALAGKHLARLTLEGERVVGEERLLTDRARIRDVRVGPDGAVYVATDESDGEILALVPKG